MSAAGDRESAGRVGEVGDRPDAARQGGWFSRVGNAVLDDETLTAHQKSIYAALCRFADRDGRCYPSLATIAAKAGCARRSVVEGLRVLEERGYVVREPRRAGRCRISNLYWVYGDKTATESEAVIARRKISESQDAAETPNAGEDGAFSLPETLAWTAAGGVVPLGAEPKAAETSPGAVRPGVSCGAAGSAEATAKTERPRFAAFSSPLSPLSPLRCPRGGGARELPRVVRDAPSPGQDPPDVVRQVPHSGREMPHPGQDVPLGGAPAASRTRLRKPDPETRRGDQREPPRPGGEEAFAAWVAGVVDRILGAGGTRK
ncbi:helix-turn-helix domain-containing protein [Aminiphilus circumscriptus]|uniref:helix-turn-helix domain-containing protein n=1 Tax=Aminiphilus circumscriptus TaxID=290732 RepID=UPI0004BA7477|nr:helix-turn-helix domain-containing protein [Aminiphilus circumscriptus]